MSKGSQNLECKFSTKESKQVSCLSHAVFIPPLGSGIDLVWR